MRAKELGFRVERVQSVLEAQSISKLNLPYGGLPGHPLEGGEFVDIKRGLPFAFIVDKSRGERLAVNKETGKAKVLPAFISAR